MSMTETKTPAAQPPAVVAQKMNVANVGVREMGGGVLFMPRSMQEVVDFSQLMAKAGPAIPPPFREKPGACMAVTMQALRWEFDPFSVIQKAYVTTDRGGSERIAYEAQLIAAVVNTRGPFEHRPKLAFEGEGESMRCTVTATIRGEREPRTIKTPKISGIGVKNSPLWKSDPEQQLSYYALRAFGRRICPEVILGVYSPDELSEMGPENATDITPPPRPKMEDFVKPAAGQVQTPPITEADEREADRLTRKAMEDGESVLSQEAADDARSDEIADHLAGSLRRLAECVGTAAVDRLEREVGATLATEPDKLQHWTDACAARAAELMKGKK